MKEIFHIANTILEERPIGIGMVSGGFISVELQTRVGSNPRAIRTSYAYKLVFEPATAGATPSITTTFDTTRICYQVIDATIPNQMPFIVEDFTGNCFKKPFHFRGASRFKKLALTLKPRKINRFNVSLCACGFTRK